MIKLNSLLTERVLTSASGKCDWKGCNKPATAIAAGKPNDRNDESVGKYCEDHAETVAYASNPEYIVNCPNCDCRFGVN